MLKYNYTYYTKYIGGIFMKFILSKTVGEDREIIDFMPRMVSWGSWENPEQLIECEYILDKDGNKTFDKDGYVLARVLEDIRLKYTDSNDNLHRIALLPAITIKVNPILIVEE
jgi:hypothetical protein